MGWRERDYSQCELFGEGAFVPPRLRVMLYSTAALVLVTVHMAAFVAIHLAGRGLGRQVSDLLGLHAGAHPVSIVTHPLATADPIVVLLSVLALWMLASRAALRHGTAGIVAIYLSGNLLAGCAYWVVGRIEPAWATAALEFPLGGLAALLLDLWPRRGEHLFTELKHVVGANTLIACGIVLAGGALVWLRGYGALAWCAAGVAGALAAPLVARLSDYLPRRSISAARSGGTLRRPVAPDEAVSRAAPRCPPGDEPLEPDIDDILAKISREGFSRLSEEERQRLEAARQAKLRRTSNA